MNRRLIHGFLLILFCLAFTMTGFAQSESYLDTIYQAGNQGSAAITDEEPVNYVTEEEEPEIVDVPDQKGIPAQQEALNKLQNMINNIMRILAGKMCGTRIVIVVIPCDRIVPKPPPTGTSTGTSTATSTGTSTSTGTATSTGTSTSTSTGTSTSTSTSTSTGTSTSTSTGTSTATSTSTSTATSTGTSTGTTKPTDVAGMRSYIKQKYNIDCTDGDRATWSINQINAADEAFESLPSFFRGATQQVFRDGPAPSFAPPSVLGYVIVPQRKVHMMDLSTKMTQGLYNSLVAAYGRAPTTEEQMYALKRNFQGTLVHEMTHCFQNTYPQVYNSWRSTFNCASSPTGYGKTQPAEDMAESVRVYWSGGSIRNGRFVSNSGVVMDMQRYEFIKTYIMKGKEYLN